MVSVSLSLHLKLIQRVILFGGKQLYVFVWTVGLTHCVMYIFLLKILLVSYLKVFFNNDCSEAFYLKIINFQNATLYCNTVLDCYEIGKITLRI